MRTPPPGGTLIRLLEYNSLMLKWNNVDMWLRIGEKIKRQKRSQKRIPLQESVISNSRDMNLLIGDSTP